MATMCHNQLAVAGPAAELRKFMKAAREKPAFGRPRQRGQARAPLSFQALLPLGDRSPEDCYGTPSDEPSFGWENEPETFRKGVLQVGYNFETRCAPPQRWVVQVSKGWPFLRFVLGYVKPDTDLAGSIYVRAGKTTAYTMGARRKEVAYAAHRRCWKADPTDPVYEETRLAMEIEIVWDLLDFLIARWERQLRGCRS